MRTSGNSAFASIRLSCGIHHRYAPIAEAERMVLAGQAVHKRLPGQRNRVYVLVDPPEASESRETPCTVTMLDVLAYVGLGGRERVEAARDKIAEIRLTAARWA